MHTIDNLIRSYNRNFNIFSNAGFDTKAFAAAEARIEKIEAKVRAEYGEDGLTDFLRAATKAYRR
jgi:hypothetical protein